MTMPESVEDQTRNCLATIGKALAEGGFAFADVVRAQLLHHRRGLCGPGLPDPRRDLRRYPSRRDDDRLRAEQAGNEDRDRSHGATARLDAYRHDPATGSNIDRRVMTACMACLSTWARPRCSTEISELRSFHLIALRSRTDVGRRQLHGHAFASIDSAVRSSCCDVPRPLRGHGPRQSAPRMRLGQRVARAPWPPFWPDTIRIPGSRQFSRKARFYRDSTRRRPPARRHLPLARAATSPTSTATDATTWLRKNSSFLPGDGIGPEAMAEVEKLIAMMNDGVRRRLRDRARAGRRLGL